MINEKIIRQLQKCKVAEIPKIDTNSTEIIINKKASSKELLEVGKYYLIELADYVINPPSTFTLADNWNGGVIPKSKCLNCYLKKIMGKMYQIDGCGFDLETNKPLDDTYLGLWIPLAGIKVLKEI